MVFFYYLFILIYLTFFLYKAWFAGNIYPNITENIIHNLSPDFLQVLVEGIAVNSTVFENINTNNYIVCPLLIIYDLVAYTYLIGF